MGTWLSSPLLLNYACLMGKPIRHCTNKLVIKGDTFEMSNSCCKLQFSLYHKIIPHFIYAEEGLFITWGDLIFQNLISI